MDWLNSNGDVPMKLEHLGIHLARWKFLLKKERKKSCTELEDKLLELYERNPSDAVLKEITNIQLNLNFEVDKEELYWHKELA